MIRTYLRAHPRLACRGLACLAVAAASGQAHADSFSTGPTHYLSAGALYSEPDNHRRADYGTGGSIGYGYRLQPRTWLEARLTNTVLETGAQTAVDFYQTTFGLDLLRSLGNESGNHFFALAGVGGALNDVKPDDKDGTSAYVDAAVGWRINASENWGVRPRFELRYVYDTFDGGQNDLMLGVAFEIPPRTERIVEKTVRVEKVVEVPVEVEKIVEKEVGCDQPGAVRPEPESPAAPAPSSPGTPATTPEPPPPPAEPAAPDQAAPDPQH